MSDEQRLRNLLVLHEGLSLEPYRCPAGHWTWGVGHNLEANPLDLDEQLRVLGEGATRAAALWLLDRDVARVREQLLSVLPAVGLLDPVRRAALLDMAFNMGVPRLLRFVKMLDALQAGNWDRAAVEALDSKWARQVGVRAERVARMLRTGEWPPEARG